MNRAERRHRTFKTRARRNYLLQLSYPDRIIDPIELETPVMCSCWMCGNPRKYCKGKEKLTRQELKLFDHNNNLDLLF